MMFLPTSQSPPSIILVNLCWNLSISNIHSAYWSSKLDCILQKRPLQCLIVLFKLSYPSNPTSSVCQCYAFLVSSSLTLLAVIKSVVYLDPHVLFEQIARQISMNVLWCLLTPSFEVSKALFFLAFPGHSITAFYSCYVTPEFPCNVKKHSHQCPLARSLDFPLELHATFSNIGLKAEESSVVT